MAVLCCSCWGVGVQSEGRLVHRTAFSRDVPEGQPRAYVTHRLAEDEDRLWDLLANR